ncbi:MAG: two pore domain potassium channel family protein [Acidobacteriaceae bacterium]|nr:two pore domain potassium channel family protein [Acidobacteriaceae bacterium]
MTLNNDVIREVTAALILIPLTLFMQSAGMAAMIVWSRGYLARHRFHFGLFRCTELTVRCTSALLILHTFQILLWTAFYRWKCFSDLERAFYFSATSYSTVGYGDVVLPPIWRLLGPIESITGVLMCGLSASLLFAVVTRLVGHEEKFESSKDPTALTARTNEEAPL